MKDVSRRVVGYWEEEIAPVVRSGKRVLVAVSQATLLAIRLFSARRTFLFEMARSFCVGT